MTFTDQMTAITTAPTAALNSSGLVDTTLFQRDPSAATAALTRAQWADYQQRFQPVETQLMNMTTYSNPEIVGQELGRAIGEQGYINKAFNTAQTQAVNNTARFGAALTPEQQAARNRQFTMSKSTAVVDAANRIRQKLIDRNQQIAVGATPNAAGRSIGMAVGSA